MAIVMTAVGIWFLHTSWFVARFPHVYAQLDIILPVDVIGVSLITLGTILFAAATAGWDNVRAAGYIVAVGVWAALSWYFAYVPADPPMVGMLFPIYCLFAILHLPKIPYPLRKERIHDTEH